MNFNYLANPHVWAMVPLHFAGTAAVFAAGWAIKRVMAQGSDLRRVHGEYVFWWAVGSYFVGWFIGPAVAGADSDGGMHGFACFCLLCGWLVGMLHGGLVLAWRDSRRPTAGSVVADAAPGTPPKPK